uniref:Protein max n=1 Tax=Microcebus murinus TaxID=30608 RepID=A0A8C5VSR2_MICMU
MSDNDDIEVESDEEQPRFQSAADKRAHHNALERKRRDHIKDSFHSLRDSVPSLQGEKPSSWPLPTWTLWGLADLMGKCHTFISSYKGHEEKECKI